MLSYSFEECELSAQRSNSFGFSYSGNTGLLEYGACRLCDEDDFITRSSDMGMTEANWGIYINPKKGKRKGIQNLFYYGELQLIVSKVN